MLYRNKLALGILTTIIIVLLATQTPLLRAIRGQTWYVWTLTIGRLFNVGPLSVPNNVAEQVAKLTAENIRLNAQIRNLQRLQEQIGMATYADYSRIDAQIIAQPVDTFQTQFIVNKGTRDGLVLGAPAVIFGSTLVGFISDLNETTAILQLLTHPGTSFPGEVITPDGTARGIVRGKSYTSVEISTLPQDTSISPGQEIVTVSQEGIVPPGLFVGRIEKTQTETHEPYQKARIFTPFDQRDLRAVSFLIAP